MTKDKTLVIGASLKKERYSNKAILLLEEYNQKVLAFGLRKGTVGNTSIDTDKIIHKDVDTVTLYVGEKRQDQELVNYIIALQPRRVIFNPGTESALTMRQLKESGIKFEAACTLVLLRTDQY